MGGKQAGLYPEDLVTAAQVDALLDHETDTLMGMKVTKYKERFGFGEWLMTDENVKKLRVDINKEVLPKHLRQLETLLQQGGTEWLAGTPGPTIADFFWVPTLQLLEKGEWNEDTDMFKPFTGLQELIKRFLALPAIADYYKSRSA